MKTRSGYNLFTPYVPGWGNLRAHMELDDADYAKIGRGSEWSATVYDHASGRIFTVRDADCGAGCHCAASIVREVLT